MMTSLRKKKRANVDQKSFLVNPSLQVDVFIAIFIKINIYKQISVYFWLKTPLPV